MDESNVSSEDNDDIQLSTPIFPVETPRRDDGRLKCFQWKHKKKRMKDSNVFSEHTNEIRWRTPTFPGDTPRREDGGLQCFQ